MNIKAKTKERYLIMKKHLFVTFLILAVILLASCSNSSSGTTAASSALQTASQSNGQSAAISIENFSFTPATLTISTGTTVIWTNNDSADHNIISDAFNSPMMSTGQTYEFKFDNAGTYNYSCGVHPSMKGVIIVN